MEKGIWTFLVTADEVEGCYKHGFSGTYKLQVGLTVVQLLQCTSAEEVTYWPLHGIRNFGFTSRTFFLYAGTRCKTGEGKFIFLTLEGEEIANCMSLQVSRLHEQEEKDKSRKEEKILNGIVQNKYKHHPIKTESNIGQSGQKSKRIPKNDYSEPVNFSHIPFTKSQCLDNSKCGKSESMSAASPSDCETGADYYNYVLYSHLNRGEAHIPENVYGMASASASKQSSRECVDNGKGSAYEYEYVS